MFALHVIFAALFASQLTGALASSQSADNSTQSFLSSANSDLPEGAFIASNLSAIADLADFLDRTPDTTVTHLLLSDSSIRDLETNWGLIDVQAIRNANKALKSSGNDSDSSLGCNGDMDLYEEPDEYLWNWGAVDCGDIDVTDDEEDALSFNRKLTRRYKQALLRSNMIVDRILNHSALTLEVFSYLSYMPKDWESVPSPRRFCSDHTIPNLLKYEYPRLRELTLRDKTAWPHCREHYGCVPGYPPLPCNLTILPFPTLSHLHVITQQLRDPLPSLSSFRELQSLTNLRISGSQFPIELCRKPEQFRNWYQELVHQAKLFFSPPSPETSPVPPNLTFAINPEFRAYFSSYIEDYDQYIARLGAMADLSFLQLIWPSETDSLKYGNTLGIYPLELAINDFRARVFDNGEGAWSAPEEIPWRDDPSNWWWNKGRNERDRRVHW